ncbi:polyprotein [Hymenoscyphus fraxineus botybirnavirus 1]|nr:polyprotein [Hymenoscyphus fraxineus botybirnavirus 1]
MSFKLTFGSMAFVVSGGKCIPEAEYYVEKTRGGINLKRPMPTRVEDSGIKAAHAMKSQGLGAEVTSSAGAGIFSEIKNFTTEQADEQFDTPTTLLEGEDMAYLSLTRTLMSRVPDVKFRDPFLVQSPTVKTQAFYMAWGYGLKSMPSSLRGSGYADKYPVTLWAPTTEEILIYPLVATSIGYKNRITTESLMKDNGNLADGTRPDLREFQSRFDEMKSLPADFRLGGDAKAIDGDNHVAWLTMAMLRILALKQAQETNSRAHVVMSDAITNTFGINLESLVVGRSNTFTAVVTALANAWFGAPRAAPRDGQQAEPVPNSMYEMILPSNAADADEVVYLAYLTGHLDDVVTWRSDGELLPCKPMYSAIVSDLPDSIKIPLANATRAITMASLRAFNTDLEVGRAESVFNAYVHRNYLHKQVGVAKRMVLLCLMDTHSNSTARLVGGLPKPNHVMEYDLWVDPNASMTNPTALITPGESAGLLVALSQVQATMRNDILCMRLTEHIESKGLDVMSVAAQDHTQDWIYDLMPGGMASWARAWLQHTTGSAPLEITRVANAGMHNLWLSVQQELMTGAVHVSAMLYYDEKPASGALTCIWDEALRTRWARQKFVTSTQSRILHFLFSGKSNIFDTVATDWVHYIADYKRRRDARKIDSSLGVRSTNTIVGSPRLIYVGLRPEAAAYEGRMAEAQDATGLANHYEPVFDVNSMYAYTPAQGPLGSKPMDRRHDNDPDTNSGLGPVPLPRKRSNSVVEQLGLAGVAPIGRFFLNQLKKKLKDPKPPVGESVRRRSSSYEEPHRRKLFNQGGVGGVRAVHLDSRKVASLNGLTATVASLKKESSTRLADIPKSLRNPVINKGSEIMMPSVERAFENVEHKFYSEGIRYTYSGMTAEMMRVLSENTKIRQVEGDGRCGARSLHSAAQARKYQDVPLLKELFEAEAQNMELGLDVKVPPTQYMADDRSLACLAKQMGTSLCIIHYEGNVQRHAKGIRHYNPGNLRTQRTLFITLVDGHYSPVHPVDRVKEISDAGDANDIASWLQGLVIEDEEDASSSDDESVVTAVKAVSTPSSPNEKAKPQPEKQQGGGKSKMKKHRRRERRDSERRADEAEEQILREAAEQSERERDQEAEGSGPPGRVYQEADPDCMANLLALKNDYELRAAIEKPKYLREQRALEKTAKELLAETAWFGEIKKHSVGQLTTEMPEEFRIATQAMRYSMWSYIQALPMAKKRTLQLVNNLAIQAGVDWNYMAQNEPLHEHELLYYLALSGVHASIIEVQSGTTPMPINYCTIVSYTTVGPVAEPSEPNSCVVLIKLDGVYRITRVIRDHPLDYYLQLKDISRYDLSHKLTRGGAYNALAPTRTKELWGTLMRLELAKLGVVTTETSNFSCDDEFWYKALEGRDCAGAVPGDAAANNIELLSCFANSLGAFEDVGWFRTQAVDWLRRQVGWVPEDQTWFEKDTVILLALERNFRVWELEMFVGSDTRKVKQYTLEATPATLPIVISKGDTGLKFHLLNLPARAGANIGNLVEACKSHRGDDGKIPPIQVPGPTLPKPQKPDNLKFKDYTQARVLGFVATAITVVVVAGFVVYPFRKRMNLNGLVGRVRSMWVGRNAMTVAQESLEEARESEPLLQGGGSIFESDPLPGPLEPALEAYQAKYPFKEHMSDAGSAHTMVTIQPDSQAQVATGIRPVMSYWRSWFGSGNAHSDL